MPVKVDCYVRFMSELKFDDKYVYLDIDLKSADLKAVDPTLFPSDKVKKDWRPGNRCLAFWLEDGL